MITIGACSSQHWEESINQLPDSDASDTDDDDECNFQGIRLELENILVRMAMILKECYYHLMHPCVRVAIPQRTSKLTGSIWVHCVLTNPNINTCYEQFRMYPKTFLKLCNTLKIMISYKAAGTLRSPSKLRHFAW
jgi:hypothetical protein